MEDEGRGWWRIHFSALLYGFLRAPVLGSPSIHPSVHHPSRERGRNGQVGRYMPRSVCSVAPYCIFDISVPHPVAAQLVGKTAATDLEHSPEKEVSSPFRIPSNLSGCQRRRHCACSENDRFPCVMIFVLFPFFFFFSQIVFVRARVTTPNDSLECYFDN